MTDLSRIEDLDMPLADKLKWAYAIGVCDTTRQIIAEKRTESEALLDAADKMETLCDSLPSF